MRLMAALPSALRGSSWLESASTGTKVASACLKPAFVSTGASAVATSSKRSWAQPTSSILVTATSSLLAPRPCATRSCSAKVEVPEASRKADSNSRPQSKEQELQSVQLLNLPSLGRYWKVYEDREANRRVVRCQAPLADTTSSATSASAAACTACGRQRRPRYSPPFSFQKSQGVWRPQVNSYEID